jgi:KDO2-lipid IV(A) lauroyltransferase
MQFAHPRYWLTWLLLSLLWLISLLPFRLINLLGSGLGSLIFRVAGSRAHVARTNIRLCFPALDTEQQEQLLKRHFRALGSAMMAMGINLWASRRRLQKLVSVRNREPFDRAIAGGKPVILLAPHFVGMEIGGLVLAPERHMLSMYQPIRNRLIDYQVRHGRERFGGIMVEHRAGMRKVVRMVRDGSPFYYLPDQDPGSGDKVFAPFFGIPVAVTPGLSRFARLTGASVIPCLTRMHERGYEVFFMPPLENFPTDDEVADATRMNEVIEQAILEMPEQYFWVHRRFKSRPPGQPSLY